MLIMHRPKRNTNIRLRIAPTYLRISFFAGIGILTTFFKVEVAILIHIQAAELDTSLDLCTHMDNTTIYGKECKPSPFRPAGSGNRHPFEGGGGQPHHFQGGRGHPHVYRKLRWAPLAISLCTHG